VRHDHSLTNYKDSCTGQPAQDIEASLKVFSKHRFVLKAEKQYKRPTETNTRPNTNTTKDLTDKSVIGEPFRQTTSGMKCFRCHEHSHDVAWCPTRSLLIKDVGLNEGNLENVYEPKGKLVT